MIALCLVSLVSLGLTVALFALPLAGLWLYVRRDERRRIPRAYLVALCAVTLAACGACASQPRVRVDLVFDQGAPPAAARDFLWAGADAWDELGVAAAPPDAPPLPECALTWWRDPSPSPCAVTVHVTFQPRELVPGHAAGATANRHTILASELSGFLLESIVAHEVGHSVWACHDHLAPGEVGIMAAASTGVVQPTGADLAYVDRATDGMVVLP